MEQETEVSIERPVVSAFLKVELGSFKVTMKTDCADLCTEDSRVNTKVLCIVGKFACERHQDFNLGSDGGFLKPAQRKKWPGRKDTLRTIGALVRKNTAQSSFHRRQHLQFRITQRNEVNRKQYREQLSAAE